MFNNFYNGADEKTRTSTDKSPLPPQGSASTNSATSAQVTQTDTKFLPKTQANMHIIPIGTDTPYQHVTTMQEDAVQAVIDGTGPETLFMVEHPSVYTMGSSSTDSDLKNIGDIPVVHTGRGGKVTYHGPGQRVVYPILDLKQRERDVRKYISNLQQWLIDSLADVGVQAFAQDDVGVWVKSPAGDEKIAAIGVRIRRWVTFHGIALNVHPNMEHFTRIVPCGIADKGVTSLQQLGMDISMKDMDKILLKHFMCRFGKK